MSEGGDDLLLSADHAEVDVLIRDALRKLAGGEAGDALKALDLFWARLAMHIRAEHLHLFPAMSRISHSEPADSIEIPATLKRLRDDHDFFMHELADLIKDMRSTSAETEREIMRQTANRLRKIETRLAEHNAIEEERIYPLQRRLSSIDSEQLSASITKELTNLPRRFSG
jgi:hemerythrin superfamily protein